MPSRLVKIQSVKKRKPKSRETPSVLPIKVTQHLAADKAMEEVSAAMDGHTSTATLQHNVASLNADQEKMFHTVTSMLSDDSAPPSPSLR